MDEVVVKIEGVSKKFCRRLRYSLLYGTYDVGLGMLNIEAKTGNLRPGEFWAVTDVSLELRKGETLGLIGPNGSGKSTLLRLINGIFPPDKGRIEIRGKIGALIAVGAGFHPLMTGRENIYLNGAIMGLSRKEIETKFDSIVDFADIGDFLDAPVRTYSSGMYVRLGFAVAIHCEPDVLLVDEILAVGDMAFQRKCTNEMSRLLKLGTSMILVSHNPYLIERMSNRVAFMEAGQIRQLGDAAEVIPAYFERSNQLQEARLSSSIRIPAYGRAGTGEIRVTQVETLDVFGNHAGQIQSGDSLLIRVRYEVYETTSDPNIGIFILNSEDVLVVSVEATQVRKGLIGHQNDHVDCLLRSLPLMPGVYRVQVRLAGNTLIDFVESGTKFTVTASPEALVLSGNKGVITVEAEWQGGAIVKS